MGEVLKLEGTTNYKICGVIKDFPGKTHLNFNMLMSGYEIPMFQSKNYFNSISTYVYFRTDNPLNKKKFETELKEFYKRHTGQEKEYLVFLTEKLTDLHLNSHRIYDFGKKGKLNILYALAIVAVLILMAACINYMNLSTTRSSYRTKEIAVRKVSGARYSDLLFQFMGESVLIAFFALFLAVVLVESFLLNSEVCWK